MTEKEWDLLDEAVNALDGTWSRGDSAGGISSDVDKAAQSPLGSEGKIVICEYNFLITWLDTVRIWP